MRRRIEEERRPRRGGGTSAAETATTVRVRNGTLSVTDGPFAETKEQLAGFYLIEARDLNEAIRWRRGFRRRAKAASKSVRCVS